MIAMHELVRYAQRSNVSDVMGNQAQIGWVLQWMFIYLLDSGKGIPRPPSKSKEKQQTMMR